jgi:hypothetical protein
MHIDDAARLIAWLCRRFEPGRLEVLNAQGRGRPVTAADFARCGRLPLYRLPSYRLVGLLFRLGWELGVSAVPYDSYSYFVGSYVMNTGRLEKLLGEEYAQVVRFTAEEALRSAAPR